MFPVSKSHSPGYHPAKTTASAPFPIARIIRLEVTRPVQFTLIGRIEAGY
jgi:hypothetical protein